MNETPWDRTLEALFRTPLSDDTLMEDADSSPLDTPMSDIPNARDVTPIAPPSLETYLGEIFPFELKVQVLKELLCLWATKIPVMALKCNPWYHEYSKSSEFYKATNRATLVYMTFPRSHRPKNRGHKKHGKERNFSGRLGWCAIPAGDAMDDYLEFGSINSPGEGPFHILAKHSFRNWAEHPIRIANILANTAFSKELQPVMERFFFGQMIWEIRDAHQLNEMMRRTNERDGTNFFIQMKNISIPASSWYYFVNLFEGIFTALKKDNRFPKIGSLEICADKLGLKSYTKRVEDDTVRFRYLVTRCYQLVKLFPQLTVCLNGTSMYDLDYGKKLDAEEHIRRQGFGFTEEEVVQFEQGTFEDAQKCPSFEYHINYDGQTPLIRVAETQWKMKFAQEWKKIWAQGINTTIEQGGYPAIFGAEDTFNNN